MKNVHGHLKAWLKKQTELEMIITQGLLRTINYPKEYIYFKRATRKKDVCKVRIMLMEYVLEGKDIFVSGFITFLDCSQF